MSLPEFPLPRFLKRLFGFIGNFLCSSDVGGSIHRSTGVQSVPQSLHTCTSSLALGMVAETGDMCIPYRLIGCNHCGFGDWSPYE